MKKKCQRLTEAPNVMKTCGYEPSKWAPSMRSMLFDLSERRINFNASSVVFDESEPCPGNKVRILNEQSIKQSEAL